MATQTWNREIVIPKKLLLWHETGENHKSGELIMAAQAQIYASGTCALSIIANRRNVQKSAGPQTTNYAPRTTHHEPRFTNHEPLIKKTNPIYQILK